MIPVMFVVVNGVPSIGVQVMVGSGKIEAQQMLAVTDLPSVSISQSNTQTDKGSNKKNAAFSIHSQGLNGLHGLFSRWVAPALLLCLVLVR